MRRGVFEVKFVNHRHTKFIFYNIIDYKMKAASQNSMYSLLNHSLNNKKHLC